jgi:hypothetical protein
MTDVKPVGPCSSQRVPVPPTPNDAAELDEAGRGRTVTNDVEASMDDDEDIKKLFESAGLSLERTDQALGVDQEPDFFRVSFSLSAAERLNETRPFWLFQPSRDRELSLEENTTTLATSCRRQSRVSRVRVRVSLRYSDGKVREQQASKQTRFSPALIPTSPPPPPTRHDPGSAKAIANRIKAKGLQKLKYYCQLCNKQCRDDNGFKCHLTSEAHLRQMEVFGQNPRRVIEDFSSQFLKAFLEH